MGIYNSTLKMDETISNERVQEIKKKTFSIDEIPIGTCYICNEKQKEITKGGCWNTCKDGEWICLDCKHKNKISLYPMACEWCTYKDVKWCQGHTYQCPRCDYLKIGQV